MNGRDNLLSKARVAKDARCTLRHLRPIAALLFAATLPACLGPLPPPPTKGYGAAYTATGKPIYVKNGRNDWNITEGQRPVTSEQALEAVKDEEYEIRRQDAKAYNDKIRAEGESNRSRGKIYTIAGVGIAILGFGTMLVVPSLVREENTTAASAGAPEQKITQPGGASAGFLVGGLVTGLIGVGLALYGDIWGSKDPPYHVWKTPKDLDRPAYVREQTEKYNESIGAPPVEEQPGSVESVPLAPGQRKPPAERPQMQKPKGGPPGAASAAPGPAGSASPPASSAPPASSIVKPGPSASPSAKPGLVAPPPSASGPRRPVRPGAPR